MKRKSMAAERSDELKEILKTQILLLENLAEEEGKLQTAVMDRDWTGLERVITDMTVFSEAAEEMEELRHRCYTDLRSTVGAGKGDGFAAIIGRLPIEERKELSGLYRKLKVAVMTVRSLTSGIGAYVAATGNTLRGIIEEIHPHQKGTLYSRHGHADRGDQSAMVVNQHL